jgi:hypothetical protein
VSGVAVQSRKHPKKTKLSDALAEDAPRIKERKGTIQHRATLIKAPGVEKDAGVDAPMRPTDEQLSRINEFTRSPKTADEVVAFSTLSMNDLPDRDDDQFTKECVADFAALEQPFSPVGKSFMLNHEYKTQNAVGRIFGVDTKKVGGANFLTNEVYMPNTDQYKGLIEDIDFGINWAVSVGVMLGKDECSLPWCKAGFSSWGWWCANGHDKGMFYTQDAEEDSWGYPIPCDPKTSGASKCLRLFKEPRDFYELSQVFLGAQYYAALEKDPSFASVMKAATAGVPLIGLGSGDLAEKLPLLHIPDKVSEAMARHKVRELEDGSLQWVDEHKMVWTFDPENPEEGPSALGKTESSDDDEEENDDDGTASSERGSGEDAGSEDQAEDSGAEPEQEDASGQGSVSDPAPAAVEQSSGEPGSLSDEEEKGVSKKSVLEAAKKAKLPDEVIQVVEKASDNGLDALLLRLADENSELRTKNSELSEKAGVADQYVKDLRAEALEWYVRANADGNGAVKTDTFEKILNRCGDDADLIKGMIEEQMTTARKRFPGTFRKTPSRSSFPVDPHFEGHEKEVSDSNTVDDDGVTTNQFVSRIHQ